MDEMVLKALGQIQKDMKELHGLMAAKKHGYKYPGFEDELKEFESEDMPEGEQDSIKFGEDEGQNMASGGLMTRLPEEKGAMKIEIETESDDMENEDEEMAGEPSEPKMKAKALRKMMAMRMGNKEPQA